LRSYIRAFSQDLRLFPGLAHWQDWLYVGFVIVFVLFGLYRVVEVLEYPMKTWRKNLFVVLHIGGVIAFGLAFLWTVLDLRSTRQNMILPFFAGSFLILAPLHIYLALLNRVRSTKPNP